jgi:virginiamycin B lyase
MPRLPYATVVLAFCGAATPAAAQTETAALPEGSGKATVEAVCTACHQTNQILNSSGYTRTQWEELIADMIDLSESPDKEAITAYLAQHFPPNSRRAAKLVPGTTKIAFKEWKVPTLGQRARDPVEAPDGAIWWAGQFGNLVGRIDPRSGEIK